MLLKIENLFDVFVISPKIYKENCLIPGLLLPTQTTFVLRPAIERTQ